MSQKGCAIPVAKAVNRPSAPAPSHACRPVMISSDAPIWTRIVSAATPAGGCNPKCAASASAPFQSISLAMPLVQ